MRCHARATRTSRPGHCDPIPSSCSSVRPSRGCPSWCRSATGACWCQRSPSTGAPRSIMASDLANTPRSGLKTQVCGDAHLMNFGVFGSPERRLVFGINDFDETFPGPWEWDVKRLAASFAIAGRDNGYTAKDRKKVLLTLLGAYRSAMREFAGDDQPGGLVLAHGRRRDGSAAEQGRRQGDCGSSPGQRRQGSQSRQHAGLRQAHPRRRRRAAHHQRPAAHPAHRGAVRGNGPRRSSWRRCAPSSAATAAPCRAIGGTCSRTSAWPTSPARSSASAASAPERGSC